MAFGRNRSASDSAYEVRCPRCDVSFPPETRTCMHCGGPTGSSGVFAALQSTDAASHDGFSSSSGAGIDQSPIEATPEAPFSFGTDPFADEGTDTDRVEGQDGEESESVGQSIFKSLGGIVWVILLIGFSIARSCGDG